MCSCTVSSEKDIRSLLKEHPNILTLWNKRKRLNEIQREALCCALKNRFQLIQGPPGQHFEHTLVEVTIVHGVCLYIMQRPET